MDRQDSSPDVPNRPPRLSPQGPGRSDRRRYVHQRLRNMLGEEGTKKLILGPSLILP
jgi:hypothetical protein